MEKLISQRFTMIVKFIMNYLSICDKFKVFLIIFSQLFSYY